MLQLLRQLQGTWLLLHESKLLSIEPDAPDFHRTQQQICQPWSSKTLQTWKRTASYKRPEQKSMQTDISSTACGASTVQKRLHKQQQSTHQLITTNEDRQMQ